MFGLLDLLALAAVVVAGLGIVNTLSMGTWERIRELGVLRAAGMSRRQVWRSVLVEAGILGTIGAIAGSIAGLGIGALLVAFAGGLGSGLQVPWGSIALVPRARRRRWRCSPRRSRRGSPAGARSWPPSGASRTDAPPDPTPSAWRPGPRLVDSGATRGRPTSGADEGDRCPTRCRP